MAFQGFYVLAAVGALAFLVFFDLFRWIAPSPFCLDHASQLAFLLFKFIFWANVRTLNDYQTFLIAEPTIMPATIIAAEITTQFASGE